MKRSIFGILFLMGMMVFASCKKQTEINPDQTLTAGTVESIDPVSLPSVVQQAVTQDFSGQSITEASKVTGSQGSVLYDVTVASNESASYSASGKKCNRIDIASLPQAISDYVTANYAGTTIKKASQITAEDGSTKIIVRLDNRKALSFDDAGNFLGEKTGHKKGKKHKKGPKGTKESIAATDLPQAAQDYITANYAEQSIAEAYKLTKEDGSIFYVAKLSNDTKVIFDASGTFIKEKADKGE